MRKEKLFVGKCWVWISICSQARDRARENEVAADIAAEFAKNSNNAPFAGMTRSECCPNMFKFILNKFNEIHMFTIFQLIHAKMFIVVLASYANQKMMLVFVFVCRNVPNKPIHVARFALITMKRGPPIVKCIVHVVCAIKTIPNANQPN